MIRKAVLVGVSVVFSATLLYAGIALAGGDRQSVPAAEAVKHLDKGKYTSAEIKTYYKELKGKTVKGTGTVEDIRTTKRNTQINILVSGTKSHKGFNEVIVTDEAGAKGLKKGDNVSCQGEFVRLMMFTNDHLIVKGKCSK